MTIMEPRRHEAWREFSLRLEVRSFIGAEVYGHGGESRKPWRFCSGGGRTSVRGRKSQGCRLSWEGRVGVSIDRDRLRSVITGGSGLLAVLACVKVAVHLLTATGSGYFVDELYYLAMQPHLDFGYVDVPPLVPALMAVSNALFGSSLFALHIFPAIAGALMLIVVGLTARELGGGRFAQVAAGLAVLVSPYWLVLDSWFAYDPFDQFVTAVLFWAWVRLMKEPSPWHWLIVGLVLGIGLLTKMSVIFTGPALGVALLATSWRRSLVTPWPWLAAAVALLVASPFIAWQAVHGWPILTYWVNYAQYRVHPSAVDFAVEVLFGVNPLVLPFILLGLLYFLVHPDGKRYRTIGIVFVVLAVLFALVLRTEPRMLTSASLPLVAGGAVLTEQLLASGSWRPRAKPAYAGLLVISGLLLGPAMLPTGDPNSWATGPDGQEVELPEYLYLRVGWPEMVAQVAEAYRALPPEEQTRAVIYAGNYGEASAIDFFGPQYGLPPAISNHNAFQVWGPGDRPGDVIIAFGRLFSPYADAPNKINLSRLFAEVRWAGEVTGNPGSPPWERHLQIYVCRKPRVSLRDVWPQLAAYY
jgi:4-amino-4-deoxy-L-arabinose transferase-like glycosyltransferase